jgi:hypothetical protein
MLNLSINLVLFLLLLPGPLAIAYMLWQRCLLIKPQLNKAYSTINIEIDKEFYK